MVHLRFTVFLLFILFFSTTVFSQKIVAFDKRGKVKRVRYYEGQFIKLKRLNGELVSGNISKIETDYFNVNGIKIARDSVKKVYRTQGLYGVRLVGIVLVTAGVVYLPLDSFNRIINDDNPTVNEKSAVVSGTFLGIGIICKMIANRGYKISPNRPLKIIDISI